MQNEIMSFAYQFKIKYTSQGKKKNTHYKTCLSSLNDIYRELFTTVFYQSILVILNYGIKDLKMRIE